MRKKNRKKRSNPKNQRIEPLWLVVIVTIKYELYFFWLFMCGKHQALNYLKWLSHVCFFGRDVSIFPTFTWAHGLNTHQLWSWLFYRHDNFMTIIYYETLDTNDNFIATSNFFFLVRLRITAWPVLSISISRFAWVGVLNKFQQMIKIT